MLGALHQSGTHRIELDVAQAGMKVRLVHRRRAEAALPQKAAPAFALVDGAGIVTMRGRKRRRETVSAGRDQDKMDMVGHEAPGPHRRIGLRAPEAKQTQIERIVAIAEEGALTAVATLGDVVRESRDDEASGSRHGSG